MNQFIPVTLAEKEKLKWYLEKSGNQSCDFSLGYNYIWNFQERLSYLIVNETLVFRYLADDTAIYRMAEYNEYFENIVSVVLEDWQETGKKLQISVLNQDAARFLESKFSQKFCLTEDRNNWDYVYSVSDLATLSGRKYHGKRNHINKFLKEYTYTYEPITKATIPECLTMAEIWLEKKPKLPELLLEMQALKKAFSLYEELNFTGALIRTEGQVQAFTLGEPLTKNMFVTHFEKAMDEIPGLYPLMNQQFAANHLSGYTYVNREEDMGLPGLQKAKLSYYPAFMVEKYSITHL